MLVTEAMMEAPRLSQASPTSRLEWRADPAWAVTRLASEDSYTVSAFNRPRLPPLCCPSMNPRNPINAIFLVAATLFPMPALFADEPANPEPKQKTYRIGTCDWSIKMPASVESFQYAKRVGLQGIQYSFGATGKGIDLRELKNRDLIRKTVKETGVGISSLGIALLNKIPLATTDESDQLVADCLNTMIQLNTEAAELDDRELAAKVSPNIVLLAFFGIADLNGSPERMQVVINKLKRFAPMAEKHGFILGLETLLDEADHRYILDSVGSPAVKVYYDTANSARMGYNIYNEIESLGSENICEIHVKENGDLLGKGAIDFLRVKTILKKINYQGWLIIEGSTPKGTSRTDATEKNAVYTVNLFNS